MRFEFLIGGYGFGFAALTYDFSTDSHIILSWTIVRNGIAWRGERHIRYRHGYNYRCIKNGKEVENLSFQSPIVNGLL